MTHNPMTALADLNPALAAGTQRTMAAYSARHFGWRCQAGVGTITLNRPDRKNPLSFESYAELRDLFRALALAIDVKVVVLQGAGDNFCSGGDVHDIIAPLTQLKAPQLLQFTRMTGDLVKAMRACPQPIIAAIDGVCAGAGAILAMASDMRLGTERSKTAFLFTRVGLAGCDMGACAILPRLIGQGRASELLYTGRAMRGDEAERWGFLNRLCDPSSLASDAQTLAQSLAEGPTFAHGMTKTMLHQTWSMGVDQAIEAEAQAQALCMLTQDFERAYRAFASKQIPAFEGH
jgi:enoyl-CoA hydratase/carnithine racemase